MYLHILGFHKMGIPKTIGFNSWSNDLDDLGWGYHILENIIYTFSFISSFAHLRSPSNTTSAAAAMPAATAKNTVPTTRILHNGLRLRNKSQEGAGKCWKTCIDPVKHWVFL